MNKSGFILIEVILATLISAILGSLLFSTLSQSQRASRRVESLVRAYCTALITLNQMEKDLAGACVPFAVISSLHDPKQTQEKTPTDNTSTATQKKKPKVPTRIFYATNKQENVDILSFISNNPLQVYWSDRSGSARPLITRITYKLEPEKGAPGVKPSYQLIRQEHALLDDPLPANAKNSDNAHIIAHNIKSCVIHCFQANAQDNKSKTLTLDKKLVWDSDKKIEAFKKQESSSKTTEPPKAQPTQPSVKTQENHTVALLPDMVSITLELWNDTKTKSIALSKTIIIAIDQKTVLKKKSKGLLEDLLEKATQERAGGDQ